MLDSPASNDNGKRPRPVRTEHVVWQPQYGPQHVLFDTEVPEVFFGGSRGGGKTDGVLGKWAAKDAYFGEHFNAVMFRRTTVSSTDAIDRSKQIFGPLGGKFNESKLTWRMPRGGRVAFGYLDSVDDAQEYQGRNLTDAWIEEAGQYPSPDPIFRLFGALRSSGGVPVQMILTGNPGGPGQSWIRDRYEMVPFPTRARVLLRSLPDGTRHMVMVIPSRLTDNKILMQADPAYASRMQLVGNAKLVRAWLDGDWNAIEGMFFEEWDEGKHVIAPFVVPSDWMRFRSMDWGSASPFSVGWWAVAGDDYAIAGGMGLRLPREGEVDSGAAALHAGGCRRGMADRVIPRGALVHYREWYGCAGDDLSVGLKLSNEVLGRGIIDREKGEKIAYGVLDPSAFKQDGGLSIAEQMRRGVKDKDGNWIGPRFREADNSRVVKAGHASGWQMLRSRLVGDGVHPMLFVFRTCKVLIKTLPMLQHDHDRPEDIDTGQNWDHAVDACFTASTLIAMADGEVLPIGWLQVGDEVMTTKGLCAVEAVFSNGVRPVFDVTFSDGGTLTATGNHPFYVEGKGFVPLAGLRYGDIMRTCERQSNSRADAIHVIPTIRRGIGVSISGITMAHCTERFGRACMGLYRRFMSFITSTATRLTTPLRIWRSWLKMSIRVITGRSGSQSISYADIAGRTSSRSQALTSSVATPARVLRGAGQGPIMNLGAALRAGASSYVIYIPRPGTVPLSVLDLAHTSGPSSSSDVSGARANSQPEIAAPSIVPVHVVSVSSAEPQKVFNLTVADAEEYFANGILVHNCRYACMSRPYVPMRPVVDKDKDRSGYSARKREEPVSVLTM